MLIQSLEKPELAPFKVSDRFHMQIVYFMTPGGTADVPLLGSNEYWVRLEEARRCLDDGEVLVISPLDAASKAHIALSEEQEGFLEWLVAHEIQHVKLIR